MCMCVCVCVYVCVCVFVSVAIMLHCEKTCLLGNSAVMAVDQKEKRKRKNRTEIKDSMRVCASVCRDMFACKQCCDCVGARL